MSECVVCGAEVTLNRDAVKGELVACKDCGTELEVLSVNPIVLAEAPKEEEDWGQ